MSELFAQLGIDTNLLLAQAVNFGIVALVLVWFVFRPLLSFMEQRRKKIEQGLKIREKAQEQLERAGKERSFVLEKAREEAQQIIAEARAQAGAEEKRMLQEAAGRAQEILRKAEQEGRVQQESLLQQTRAGLAQAALLAAEKVVARKMGKEDEARIAEELKAVLQ